MNDLANLERAAALAAPWMTFPNPRVGCVIVDASGNVVGEGAHQVAGTAHAEVHALTVAGESARGATAYVTLEPCAHVGRTGPCADALIAAGIVRVVVAEQDPNPQAAGGIARLRAAGVQVDLIDCPNAFSVNEHWLHAMRAGRPFVTVKMATSIDGRVAAAVGQETNISNVESRRRVHELRSRVDGILVGSNTAVIDDPMLTVRDVEAQRQPQRYVLGTRELPGHLQLLQGSEPALQLSTRDPAHALALLHARSCRHLLIEGGPSVVRAFVGADLVDELVWITAPTVLGAGPLALGDGLLDRVRMWRRIASEDVAGDLWSTLRP